MMSRRHNEPIVNINEVQDKKMTNDELIESCDRIVRVKNKTLIEG